MGIKQSILDYEKLKDSVTAEFKKKGLSLPKSGDNSVAAEIKKKGTISPAKIDNTNASKNPPAQINPQPIKNNKCVNDPNCA